MSWLSHLLGLAHHGRLLIGLWSLNPIADITAAVTGVVGAIQGNQQYKRNKGRISQAYRQNVAQTNLQQANTREDTNESLNARGVLTAGAGRVNPTSITQAVAASGGKGGGGGLSPYLAQAGVGAIGPANTLSGGANAQMTDQFALEDKANHDAYQQAMNQNSAGYANTILGAVAGAGNVASNIQQGQAAGQAAGNINATTPTGTPVPSSGTMSGGPMTGQWGAVNPTFNSPSSGTRIGDGSVSNYSFNVG